MTTMIVDDSGFECRLGNLEAPISYAWPAMGNADVIPRSQWQEVDLSAFVSPVKNQGQTSSCNAFSSVNCVEATRRAAGLPDVKLSPGHLYGRINGGRDQGSYLEEALKMLASEGVCTADTVPELSWQPSTWPAHSKSEALAYKAAEWDWLSSFDALATAIQRMRFCNIGVSWYQNYVVDSTGWLPSVGRGEQGGHAICACGLMRHHSGGWGIKFVNSWSPRWGIKGFGILPETAFGRRIGGFWGLRVTTTETSDTPAPKAA